MRGYPQGEVLERVVQAYTQTLLVLDKHEFLRQGRTKLGGDLAHRRRQRQPGAGGSGQHLQRVGQLLLDLFEAAAAQPAEDEAR